MPGDGTVFHGRGPFADRDRVLNLAEPVALEARMTGAADGAGRPQMRQQLLLEHASRLYEQASVDRLMGHAGGLVVGMLTLQPARDLLRPPLRRTSRLIVDGARQSSRAMARKDICALSPLEISSRSESVNANRDLRRSGGRMPPVRASNG